MLIDTHCHIHESYELPISEVLQRAVDADVLEYICVGTSEKSSKEAIDFAVKNKGAYAVIGVHPHDTKDGYSEIATLAGSSDKIIAVGEIGLDYFYTHSPREMQMEALEWQIQIALKHNLPIIFHVREAFDDFWPIFDSFEPGSIRGVLHSFTDSAANMDMAVQRGLYIGVNGIATFAKEPKQLAVYQSIPEEHLLLETDAPFLTPVPFRGKINEPKQIITVAEFLTQLRSTTAEQLAQITTNNARALFDL